VAEGHRVSRARSAAAALGAVPFLVYVAVFLVVPTVTIAISAFAEGSPVSIWTEPAMVSVLVKSLIVSGSTALIGAVVGGLLAYVVVIGNPDGVVRRTVTSFCAVIAQFGGVALAFAFIATVGLTGVVTVWLQEAFAFDLAPGGWLFDLPGLILVYTYFQIPLMVVVFVPAVEGLRVQWREAAETLGASPWQYWKLVGLPLLAPAFLGSVLLLFANAFAAYATAAALVSQGSPLLPLQVRTALTNEVLIGAESRGYAVALEMIVVVAVVMTLYALVSRRAARWLR
jgi:putative spermidine/putrescine transport system permease protein